MLRLFGDFWLNCLRKGRKWPLDLVSAAVSTKYFAEVSAENLLRLGRIACDTRTNQKFLSRTLFNFKKLHAGLGRVELQIKGRER